MRCQACAGPRLEFASPDWFEQLFRSLRNHQAGLNSADDQSSFSLCEVVTDAPGHLTEDLGDPIAWWLQIERGELHSSLGVRDDMTFRTSATYADARQLALAPLIAGAASGSGVHVPPGASSGATGKPTVPAAAMNMLRAVHECMARRTQ